MNMNGTEDALRNGEKESVLVVLFETNPEFWNKLAKGTTDCFDATLAKLITFISGYFCSGRRQKVVVLKMDSGGCQCVYASAPGDVCSTSTTAGICTQILECFLNLMMGSSVPRFKTTTPLAHALSSALCYLHRFHRKESVSSKRRIVCIKGSQDSVCQYTSVMDAIFSAQRESVSIDAYNIGRTESAFLQKAAHITGGTYRKPRSIDSLLQHMLVTSTLDRYARDFMQHSRGHVLDLRVSCLCHRRNVDLGFVCSTCLSTFCCEFSYCLTCRMI